MQTAKHRAMTDEDLQAINTQMLQATWEAGLPTASGVAEALAATTGSPHPSNARGSSRRRPRAVLQPSSGAATQLRQTSAGITRISWTVLSPANVCPRPA